MVTRGTYLALALATVIASSAILVLRRDLRRPMLVLAAFGAVWGPVSEHWFEMDYWSPQGVFGNPWFEDILYGAGISALSAGIYLFLSGRRTGAEHARIARYAAVLAYVAVYVGAMQLTRHVVNSIVVAMVINGGTAVIILTWRRDLVPAAAWTSGLLALFAIIVYVVGLDWVVDGKQVLRTVWLIDGQRLGVTILGNVPLTEVLWYACWGLLGSVAYPYLRGARLQGRAAAIHSAATP